VICRLHRGHAGLGGGESPCELYPRELAALPPVAHGHGKREFRLNESSLFVVTGDDYSSSSGRVVPGGREIDGCVAQVLEETVHAVWESLGADDQHTQLYRAHGR